MLKKLIILFVFLFHSFSNGDLVSQTNFTESSDVYNYWAKLGIVEMINAFMVDYMNTVEASKSEKEGQQLFNKTFVQNYEKTVYTLDDDTLFTLLKNFLISNDWKGVQKNMLTPLYQNYTTRKPIDNTFFETTKPGSNILSTEIPGQKNNREVWEKTKARIINDYHRSLKSILGRDDSTHKENNELGKINSTVATKKLPIDEIKSENETKQNRNGFLIFYFVSFIIGLFLGGYIVYLISSSKIESILDEEKNDYFRFLRKSNKSFIFKYLGLVYILKERKNEHKSNSNDKQSNSWGIKNLEREYNELKKENEQLRLSVTSASSEKNLISEQDDIGNKENKTIQESAEKVLFFNIPDSDGTFNIEKGEKIDDGRKLFKIEYEKDRDIGNVSYISGEFDKKAINNIDFFLIPVCEIENISNRNSASKILMTAAGIVILRNNKWTIDPIQKIKIKLI